MEIFDERQSLLKEYEARLKTVRWVMLGYTLFIASLPLLIRLITGQGFTDLRVDGYYWIFIFGLLAFTLGSRYKLFLFIVLFVLMILILPAMATVSIIDTWRELLLDPMEYKIELGSTLVFIAASIYMMFNVRTARKFERIKRSLIQEQQAMPG